jgi:hypothetical protein
VYTCKSDDQSRGDLNGIALSVTCFPDVSLTFAMLYGCTDTTIEFVTHYLDMSQEWGPAIHHPLILLMIFVEGERTRLFRQLELDQDDLSERIMDLKNQDLRENSTPCSSHCHGVMARLNRDQESRGWTLFMFWRGGGRSNRSRDGELDRPGSSAVKECVATEVWIRMSSLKNGLQSFQSQLHCLLNRSHGVPGNLLTPSKLSDGIHIPEVLTQTGQQAQARLQQMVTELDCKIRSAETILAGVVMATQVVSSVRYCTRPNTGVRLHILTTFSPRSVIITQRAMRKPLYSSPNKRNWTVAI